MECVHSFGFANSPNSQFADVSGICVDANSGNLFVSDAGPHCVLVFDKVGAYLRSISDTPRTLDHPWGLRHHAGLLYIADCYHHRVAVYDSSSGELVRSIGVPDAGDSSNEMSDSLNALVCNNVFR